MLRLPSEGSARSSSDPPELKRALFIVLVVVGALAWPARARAWYFPEHVVITQDAVTQLSPEMRTVLQKAVEHARAEGLHICPVVDVGLEEVSVKPLRTRMLRAELGAECVPFAALPAIAGDHADGASELWAIVSSNKGLEITAAAAHEWRRFLEAVERSSKAPLERMSFVHELDVDFYFIDPGYELRAQRSRSHFVDAGRSLEEVVRNAAVAGAVDNAVGQFVIHHLRSLELAGRKRDAEALLEHAFAVHFLQDAFSSGHLVMTDRLWANGNTFARRRHDFFDAAGLRVKRAMATEPCSVLDESFEAGLPPCWTTNGDGYLGVAKDASDRTHVVRAVKKAELELAMALDAPSVVALFDSFGEGDQIAFAATFDPMPWWTLPRRVWRTRHATAEHSKMIVRGAVDAVERLRAGTAMPAVDVGARSRGRLVDDGIVATAIDPCIALDAEQSDDKREEDACGPDRRVGLGTIGASLLRPLLVELPAAQDDVSKLEGAAADDHGMAFQLVASVGAGTLFPKGAPVDVYAPGLGVSMGLAYRFGTYLPGRRNRSAFELNAGVSTSLHYDTHGAAGGRPQITMLDQEIRWPILWELLTSYVKPLDLRASHDAGSLIVLGGARLREVLTDPAPKLWGIDFEIAAIALSRGGGAYPLYSVSPELRLHFGLADPSVAQPSLPGKWGPTVGISLTGGYATFL